jgi:ankyrin repeat protein
MSNHKIILYEFVKGIYKTLNRDVLELIVNRYILDNVSLYDACTENWFYAIDLLISNNFKLNECHMTIVSEYGYLDLVKFFNENWGLICDKNYDDDCNSPIDMACANGHLEIVKYLIENKKGYTKYRKSWHCSTYAFDSACESGHLEIVKYLTLKKVHGTYESFENAYNNNHTHIIDWLNENMYRYINCYADRNFYF